MKWWLSKPESPVNALKGTGSFEETVNQSIMLTSVQSLLALGPPEFDVAISLWIVLLLRGNGYQHDTKI